MTVRPGLILLNKPAGITSFQLLGPVKRKLGTRKIGHAGTLDKFARGLMLVFVGQATRFVQYLSGADKEYLAEFRFGEETSTLDPEGEVLYRSEPPARSGFESIMDDFRGPVSQKPPVYSAVHIDGKRAYQRANAGENVEMPERRVEIHRLELLSWEDDRAEVLVDCSKGTYIRSLARDMAIAAGSRAHVSALERLRVGGFQLGDALDFEEFNEMSSAELQSRMIWGRKLIDSIGDIGALNVAEDICLRIDNGKHLSFHELGIVPDNLQSAEHPDGTSSGSDLYALIDGGDHIRALVEADGERGRIRYRGVFNRLDI